MQKWKDQIGWFMDSNDCQELNGIDGEPVEFEWNILPGQTILDLLHEIQRKMAENRIKPEEFEDRITFMSMYNDIDRTKEEENFTKCVSKMRLTHTDFQGTLVIPRTRNGRNGMERTPPSPKVCKRALQN